MPAGRFAAGISALAFALSCGGEAAKPAAEAPRAAPAAQQVAETPLEPVAAPRELFAVARIRSVAKLADVGVRWTSLPVDWRNLIAKELPGVQRFLAFDAPMEAAASLDPASIEPHVFWAFSFGVTSADEAAAYFRSQGDSVVRRGPGVYVLRMESMNCQIAPARGGAPARVVCSDAMDSVDALSPYMTRGLPTETFGTSEVHVVVSAEPFRRRYSSELALIKTMGVPFLLRELELGHPKFDRALRDTVYDFADEVIALAKDLDRLEMDAAFSPREDAIDTRMAVAMSGQKSWISQSIVRAAGSSGPAPDFFWRLPKDATAASYGTYADPEHARGFATSLGQLLDGWLDYSELGDAQRRPLVEAFEDLFTIGAQSAYAILPMAPPARPPSGSDAPFDLARTVLGSHVFAVDHGGERLQRFASELVKSVGQRSFRDHIVKAKLLRPDQLPVARERAPKGKPALPPGSKTFEFEFSTSAFSSGTENPPKALEEREPRRKKPGVAAPAKPVAASKASIVLVVMPDGAMTWFGFGIDEAALVERLAEVKADGPSKLAARNGLEPLRTERAISAGFSSLAASLASLDSSYFSSTDAFGGPRVLGRLPHRGETPVLWHVLADPLGPKMTASAVIPQAVIEDIVALTVSAGSGASKFLR